MLHYFVGSGRRLALVAGIVLLGSNSVLAQAPVTDCDRLAANPTDARKAPSVPGVQFKQVRENLNAALQACSSAVQAYPEELRFRYQYARALQIRDKRRAFSIFSDLSRQNYAAAYDNVGWLLISELNDYENAVRAFQAGYALGDADCAVSLYEMIGSDKWQPADAQKLRLQLLEKAVVAGHVGAITALPIERAKQANLQQWPDAEKYGASSGTDKGVATPTSPSVASPQIATPVPDGGSQATTGAWQSVPQTRTVSPTNGVSSSAVDPERCVNDWRACADNEQVTKKWSNWTKARLACEKALEESVKYGRPKYSSWFFRFGTFLQGRSYVTSGMAVIIEEDVQIQNAYGALVNVEATCRFDLATRQVVDISVQAR